MRCPPLCPSVALSLVGLLCVACDGEALDAGTTFVSKVSDRPMFERAAAPAMIDAVTMDDENLYFTCEDGGIYRLAKKGTAAPDKISTFPGSYAWGIAVDESFVYVTALVDGENGGAVVRAPKGGGASTMLAAAQSRPWGIAVDDTQIYWVSQGASPYDNAVSGLDLGGILVLPKSGASTAPKVLVSKVVTGDMIALDAESVYWHELQSIGRVSKLGGTPVTLAASTVHTTSTNLIVAGGRVHWAQEAGAWSVFSVATTGGDSITLAANIPQPSSLASMGNSLYWSDAQGSSVGAIHSVSLNGGTQTILSPQNAADMDDHVVSFVLVDAQAFYSVQYRGQPKLKVVIDELPR
jgi:hypothetical protein